MQVNEEQITTLIEVAAAVRERAYAPYSHFKVGAALLTGDGRIFSGCNIENASYGATICAERAAVAAAVSEGCTEVIAVCIVAGDSEPVAPCGICRQVLYEFNPEMAVIMAGRQNHYTVETLRELFPRGFNRQTLGTNDAADE